MCSARVFNSPFLRALVRLSSAQSLSRLISMKYWPIASVTIILVSTKGQKQKLCTNQQALFVHFLLVSRPNIPRLEGKVWFMWCICPHVKNWEKMQKSYIWNAREIFLIFMPQEKLKRKQFNFWWNRHCIQNANTRAIYLIFYLSLRICWALDN